MSVEVDVAAARAAASLDVILVLEDIRSGVVLSLEDRDRARHRYGIEIDRRTGRMKRWRPVSLWKGGAL